MQELQKLHRVMGKQLPGAPHEVLLVLDATTGMNALNQAREFNKAVPLSGLDRHQARRHQQRGNGGGDSERAGAADQVRRAGRAGG